jgi:hypothetical protein
MSLSRLGSPRQPAEPTRVNSTWRSVERPDPAPTPGSVVPTRPDKISQKFPAETSEFRRNSAEFKHASDRDRKRCRGRRRTGYKIGVLVPRLGLLDFAGPAFTTCAFLLPPRSRGGDREREAASGSGASERPCFDLAQVAASSLSSPRTVIQICACLR